MVYITWGHIVFIEYFSDPQKICNSLRVIIRQTPPPHLIPTHQRPLQLDPTALGLLCEHPCHSGPSAESSNPSLRPLCGPRQESTNVSFSFVQKGSRTASFPNICLFHTVVEAINRTLPYVYYLGFGCGLRTSLKLSGFPFLCDFDKLRICHELRAMARPVGWARLASRPGVG
jgi:hypothetical protein